MMEVVIGIILAAFITVVFLSVIAVGFSLTMNVAFDFPDWGWLEWIDEYLIPALARAIVFGGGLLIICFIICLIKIITI